MQLKNSSSNNRYLYRFFGMNTAPLLMTEKVFPNLKEVTESIGAFEAINKYVFDLGYDRKDDSIQVLVVGDGNTPRTAALIACMTKWTVHSVDPRMKDKNWNFKRLHTYKNKVENIEIKGKKGLIVCVHSHAKLSDSIAAMKGFEYLHLINIPCCVKPDISKPDVSYIDESIHSGKRNVELYFNVA